MIKIKTFEGDVFSFKTYSTFIEPEKEINNGAIHYIRFLKDRVELLYFKSFNRCGIQYLGYDEFTKLHPYADFYNSIKNIPRVQYSDVLKKIRSKS